jgi:predicted glycoside hydrolase/deacetylase ChbG (UPF0249 family)
LLPAQEISSLVNERGEFYYRTFDLRARNGLINFDEARAEMLEQIRRTEELCGRPLSHVDGHADFHKRYGFYSLFLDVLKKVNIQRTRGFRNRIGIEGTFPRLAECAYYMRHCTRYPRYWANVYLIWRAHLAGIATPDFKLVITGMKKTPRVVTVENFQRMLVNVPVGYSEFTAHPAIVDSHLRRWSTYLDQREREREVLTDPRFLKALQACDVELVGYNAVPLLPSDIMKGK